MQSKFLTPKPVVIAHRGDSTNYPENTLPAFLGAIELKVDIIETDVHLTKDNKLVIWHDYTLERNTNGKGTVEEHTYKELQKLDAGYNFTKDNKTFPFRNKNIKIITFEEALINCPNQRFNVDLKTKDTLIVDKCYEVLERQNAFDRVCIASFSSKNIKTMRKKYPKVITSATVGEIVSSIFKTKLGLNFKKKNPLIIQPPSKGKLIKVTTPRYIKNMHKNNHIIQVWTINKEKEMRDLLKMGIDAIMTDNPRLLIKVKNSL